MDIQKGQLYLIFFFYVFDFSLQVCHHYLIPLLSQIPLDASLFKKDTSQGHMGPPDTTERMESGEAGDSSKENVDPLLQDLQV